MGRYTPQPTPKQTEIMKLTFIRKLLEASRRLAALTATEYVNDPVSCCMYVLSPTVQALRCFLRFPLRLTAPLLGGLPPCWVVLCSISCFSLKSNCLLFASTLPLNFPPFPILSTHSSLLLYSLPLPLILHSPPTLLFLCSYHLIDCLLMPPFLPPLSSLNPSYPPLFSHSSHAAAQPAAGVCAHASP